MRAFSLLELIVVMSVAVVLAGILLPSLSSVRENVKGLVCSSNLRQVGISMHIYVRDHKEALPYSRVLDPSEWTADPRDLMAVHLEVADEYDEGWDSLGLLYRHGYCGAVECFYCPSHNGEHALEDLRPAWDNPGGRRIYANYHYAGDRDWENTNERRRIEPDLVLATDGFRSLSDFNHSGGMNLLSADGAVRWWEDGLQLRLMMSAASQESAGGGGADDDFRQIWSNIQNSARH